MLEAKGKDRIKKVKIIGKKEKLTKDFVKTVPSSAMMKFNTTHPTHF